MFHHELGHLRPFVRGKSFKLLNDFRCAHDQRVKHSLRHRKRDVCPLPGLATSQGLGKAALQSMFASGIATRATWLARQNLSAIGPRFSFAVEAQTTKGSERARLQNHKMGPERGFGPRESGASERLF